jgi:hypothetical protein
MGADGVFQFKQPLFPIHRGTAEEDLGFDPHKTDGFHTDDLVNVDAQDAVSLILHSKPQRTDLPGSAADRDHIDRADLIFHRGHLLFLFYYSTFVRFYQVKFLLFSVNRCGMHGAKKALTL